MMRFRWCLSALLALVPLPVSAADASVAANPALLGLHSIRDGDLLGFNDRSGRVVVPPVYSHSRPYEKALALVLDQGRSMYSDAQGAVMWSKP